MAWSFKDRFFFLQKLEKAASERTAWILSLSVNPGAVNRDHEQRKNTFGVHFSFRQDEFEIAVGHSGGNFYVTNRSKCVELGERG